MATEVQIPPSTGSLTATVLDSGGAEMSVIRSTDNWQVDFDLTVDGPIWQFFTGTLKFQVVLESIGGAPMEFEKSVSVPLNPALPVPAHYTQSVQFTPADINLGTEDSVAFKALALVTARGTNPPNSPLPVAGYVELGIVQIYRQP
jgi:hypothetical protein